jgi:broad specificity phosphatase PhoE
LNNRRYIALNNERVGCGWDLALAVAFIRHAESESNAGLPTTDPASIALTENGRLQAVDFAEKITQQPDLVIVTSYLRTSQTALPLVNRFIGTKVETWP